MKFFITALLLTICMNASAQSARFDTSTDAKNGSVVYRGRISFSDLKDEKTFTWMKTGYDEYKPDEKAIDYLKYYMSGVSMVVFMGTWCSDSQDMIPRLEKVIDMAAFPKEQVVVYGVDRSKTTKNGEEKKYNITLVPTVILFKDNTEIGRITETVQKSVEADLAGMIKP